MEKLTAKFDKLFDGIKDSDIILDPADPIFKVNSEKHETPLIFIPRDEPYIEILGNRIDGVDSFESFIEYLKKVDDIEKENKQLKKELDDIYNKRANFIDYLNDKLEESMLYRTQNVNKDWAISVHEMVYRDILGKVDEYDR